MIRNINTYSDSRYFKQSGHSSGGFSWAGIINRPWSRNSNDLPWSVFLGSIWHSCWGKK